MIFGTVLNCESLGDVCGLPRQNRMTVVFHLARSAKLIRVAIELWAALLLISVASASGPGVSALPNTESSRGLLTSPWTIADLDGDHHPDSAQSSEVGTGVQGYHYRVDFQLSGGAPNKPFTVSTRSRLGLNIVPRDIDGDNDLDLVITTGALHQLVGIWLNDGNGEFTPADASLYPNLDGTQGHSFVEARRIQSYFLELDEGRRPISIIPETTPLSLLNTELARLRFAASAPTSLDHAGTKKSRAPPLSLHS